MSLNQAQRNALADIQGGFYSADASFARSFDLLSEWRPHRFWRLAAAVALAAAAAGWLLGVQLLMAGATVLVLVSPVIAVLAAEQASALRPDSADESSHSGSNSSGADSSRASSSTSRTTVEAKPPL